MKNIRILVTGLCLSRNRGGPAMALSFIEQIKRYLSAEFIFAVDPMYIDLERKWADRYGVKVIGRDSFITSFLQSSPIQLLRRLKRRLQGRDTDISKVRELWHAIHKEYQDQFDKVDCVINLNGITFVGDGTRSWLGSLSERTCSIYAKRHKKPFFRFIQSYGPLTDWRVKLLAKMEFRELPCVMARGELAASYCRKVAGRVPVYAFPDVAIALPGADEAWLNEYLKRFKLKQKSYIVLSPSAVMAAMSAKDNSSVGSKHVAVYTLIARHHLSLDKSLLFVPHMTSPTSSQCDRVVCRQVVESLAKEGIAISSCHIVEDELDCRELKALISGAKLAIVSRYHALVAALSTGVPSVSVGWNDKYEDLLNFYKASEFAVNARMGEPPVVAEAVIKNANNWSKNQIELVKNRQPELEKMVNKAGKICGDWILNVTK